MHSLFASDTATTWAAIVGSGVFHGINPAMGWLFATAIGLQRGSRSALLLALPPIALGHAASILLFTSSVAVLSAWTSMRPLHLLLGATLIGWAAWQHVRGHRHRVRIGMTAGFAGLAMWSAAMATMHGAGLMLMPALLSLCGTGAASPSSASPASSLSSAAFTHVDTLLVPLQFAAIHTIAMLATTAAIALLAYEYLGVGILRRGWINFDWLWSGALATTGAWLIISG